MSLTVPEQELLERTPPKGWAALQEVEPRAWLGGTAGAGMERLRQRGLVEELAGAFQRTGLGSAELHNATRGKPRRR